jgi:hypothetical protein
MAHDPKAQAPNNQPHSTQDMKDLHVGDPLMTPIECGVYLNDIAVATLSDWRVRRQGPPWISVGHSIRYRRSSVDQWLASRTQKGD